MRESAQLKVTVKITLCARAELDFQRAEWTGCGAENFLNCWDYAHLPKIEEMTYFRQSPSLSSFYFLWPKKWSSEECCQHSTVYQENCRFFAESGFCLSGGRCCVFCEQRLACWQLKKGCKKKRRGQVQFWTISTELRILSPLQQASRWVQDFLTGSGMKFFFLLKFKLIWNWNRMGVNQLFRIWKIKGTTPFCQI